MSKAKVKTVTGTSLGDAKMPTLRDKLNGIETPVAPIPKAKPASKGKGLGKKVGAKKK